MKTNLDQQNGILTITLAGDLTSTTAAELRTELGARLDTSSHSAPTWRTLRLELPAAKMVDSVGLNLIISLLKVVQQRGAKMQILCVSPNVHRTFLFTRLDKHVEIIKV